METWLFSPFKKGYFFVNFSRASGGATIISRFDPLVRLNSKSGKDLMMRYWSIIVVPYPTDKNRVRGDIKELNSKNLHVNPLRRGSNLEKCKLQASGHLPD